VRHIIWDWNGTLLDDLEIVVHAVDTTVRRLGGPPVTVADYQANYTRPVKVLYERLTGRAIPDTEWARIDVEFHDVYNDGLSRIDFADSGRAVLETVGERGWTQSLLSMYAHEDLVGVIDRFGLGPHFTHVQGLVGPPGGRKAEHLGRHLTALAGDGIDPTEAVMIGDTPDDAHAALEHGIPVVLYDGGSHHRHHLDEVGVPVADTLPAALALVLQP
jgi:phosphoglycolate phosphatase-like HAD superfamily hydrolase